MNRLLALEINENTFPAARFSSVASLLNIFIPLVELVAALIFLGMLLYAAFLWMTAGDKKDNVGKAQSMITWSVIGLIFIIISYIVVKVLASALNVQNQVPI